MALRDKLNLILGLKNTLANNINAKGVEASTTEGMTTLVPKVSEIGGHITDEDIEWVENAPTFTAGYFFFEARTYQVVNRKKTSPVFNAIKGFRDRTTASIDGLNRVLWINTSATYTNTSIEWITFDLLPSTIQYLFCGLVGLKRVKMPKCEKINHASVFAYCTGIVSIEVGKLLGYAMPSSLAQSEFKNWRSLIVGQGTDIDMSSVTWTASNVIAEGEASCLELINNARTGLYDRVADHRGEGLVRTITAGWVGTLRNSEYPEVVEALNTLVSDFANIGWDLKGVE